ncbi:MAG: RagB/SusD family nutrient uptake outer membrane protein [Sphingobacteriales bacterium]
MKLYKLFIPVILLLSTVCYSCKKYLDAKPDRSLEEPSTLQDYQAMLDFKTISANFPFAGDIGSDDYYLTYTSWNALLSVIYRDTYVWAPNAVNDQDWQYMYGVILDANIVIDGTGKLPGKGNNAAALDEVKGSAYFVRGYCYYQLANVFTLPYSNTNSTVKQLGLPLHLEASITTPTVRATLAQTYGQIISDLKTAAALLPVQPLVKTRPCKPAAFGALSRAYLAMGNYVQAGLYADSCLQLQNKLIDYNTLNPLASLPFPLFNTEVIFHNTTSGRGAVVSPSRAIVDSNLYRSYADNDLRKVLFFKMNAAHLPVFKGDYGGSGTALLFGGIATDEMYLVRAECHARNNEVASAISDLNMLLVNRYATGTYTAYPITLAPDSALSLILSERRKELAFRSEIRWGDLRRLNQDERFALTLTRNLNGTLYTLPPNDKRYAYLIPVSVIQLTGIPQNER